MSFPSINSKVFTVSAFFIGYFLIDDFTPAEQNSLGNWFMLVGQALCTNSAQQQVINNNNSQSNSTNSNSTNSNTTQRTNKNFTQVKQETNDIEYEIQKLNKVIVAMQKEIEILKKQL